MGGGTVSTVCARHLEADLAEDGFPCKVLDPTVLTQMYPRTSLVIAESRTVGDLHRVCMVKEGERASGKPLDEVREVLLNFLAKQQDGKHSVGPATQFLMSNASKAWQAYRDSGNRPIDLGKVFPKSFIISHQGSHYFVELERDLWKNIQEKKRTQSRKDRTEVPFASKPIPSAEESPEWRSILKECKHMFEVEYAQLERMYTENPQTHALWLALTMSPNKEVDHIRNKLNRLFRDKKLVRTTLGLLDQCELGSDGRMWIWRMNSSTGEYGWFVIVPARDQSTFAWNGKQWTLDWQTKMLLMAHTCGSHHGRDGTIRRLEDMAVWWSTQTTEVDHFPVCVLQGE